MTTSRALCLLASICCTLAAPTKARLTNEVSIASSPAGMLEIQAGTNTGDDPDFGAYSLEVQTFHMDKDLVGKMLWDDVLQWAITNGYTFASATPAYARATNHPVHTVNWYDAVKWCNARSEKDGFAPVYQVDNTPYRTGTFDNVIQTAEAGYRLPTTTEWEYAARAGLASQRFPWGNTINHSNANYVAVKNYSYDTSGLFIKYHDSFDVFPKPYTSPAGALPANNYGLHDMSGNLFTWCFDPHPTNSAQRVIRGGSWDSYPDLCRIGHLGAAGPTTRITTISFRTVFAEPSGSIIRLEGNMTFGQALTGETARLACTIYNDGNLPMNVTGISLPAGFSADWLSGTIATGTTQRVTISFSPDALQSYGGTIEVLSDAMNTHNSLPCEGVGVAELGPYLVLDLAQGSDAQEYQSWFTDTPTGTNWSDEFKTTKLVLKRIPAGTFIMGSPTNELGRHEGGQPDNREAQREVTLTHNFFVSVFPVTQRQWERVMGNWPSYFRNPAYRDTRPVESVSFYQVRENPANTEIWPSWPQSSQAHANSFIGRLRTRTGLASLDLPTSAQWEYACRAGTLTALNNGLNLTAIDSCPNLAAIGRYFYNGGLANDPDFDTAGGTAPVGSYLPNAWGLYDMHGNVHEWHLDRFSFEVDLTRILDPEGPSSGTSRNLAGGAAATFAYGCRSASRWQGVSSAGGSTTGFRLAMPVYSRPVVRNLAAMDVGGDAATLGGDLRSAGLYATNAQISLCWGETDGSTNMTAWTHVEPIGTLAPGFFLLPLQNLSPDTTYHYRVVASNRYGVVWAPATDTFRTAASLTLQVFSAQGNPVPTSGVHNVVSGQQIEASVEPVLENSGRRYRNTGWLGTGSVPAQGFTNQVAFTIDGDSSITWLWNTNYWLEVAEPDHGSLDVSSQWIEDGTTLQITATPFTGYAFTGWSGTVYSQQNPLILQMNRTHSLQANFAWASFPYTATASSGGTIEPAGSFLLPFGASTNLIIAATGNYHIARILVDGISIMDFNTTNLTHTLTYTNINQGHSIEAFFNSGPTIRADVSPTNGVAPLRVCFDLAGSRDPENNLALTRIDRYGNDQWTSFAGKDAVGMTLDYAQPGIYTSVVEVLDGFGLLASTSVVISVLGPAPGAQLTASPATGSAPLDAWLDASASTTGPGSSIVAYEWDVGGNGTFDLTSTTGRIAHLYGSTGIFHPAVRVTDAFGRQDTQSTTIQIDAPPPTDVMLSASVLDGAIPLDVTFTAQPDAPDAVQAVAWDFDGDGVIDLQGNGLVVTQTFSRIGQHQPQVFLTYTNNLTASSSVTIITRESSTLQTWLEPLPDSLWGSHVGLAIHTAPAHLASNVRLQYQLADTTSWIDITPPPVAMQAFHLATWDTTTLIPDGIYSLRALATDPAGQISTSKVATVKLDATTLTTTGHAREFRLEDSLQKTLGFDHRQTSHCRLSDGTLVTFAPGTFHQDGDIQVVALAATNAANGAAIGKTYAQAARTITFDGTNSMSRPIFIEIPYDDVNHDGIVDGTSIPAATLAAFIFDETTATWQRSLASSVDCNTQVVRVRTTRPGLLALFGEPNILHHALGGRLIDETQPAFSEHATAANLADGNPASYWQSSTNPIGNSVFNYTFNNQAGAVLASAALQNAYIGYASKDFRVEYSPDGTNFTTAISATLPDDLSYASYNLGNVTGRFVRLVIESGYHPDFRALGSFSVTGSLLPDPPDDYNGFEYVIGPLGAYITGHKTGQGNLVIPSIIEGHPVISIYPFALRDCINMTGIVIPESITSINDSAFLNCSALTSVTLPDSITGIGPSLFRGCSSLTNVTFGSGITAIPNQMFYDCTSLQSMILPPTIASIGSEAFRGCSSLSQLSINANVETIGKWALWLCDSLTDVTVANDNAKFSDLDGVLCDKSQATLPQYPIGRPTTSYAVPPTVTNVAEFAFYGATRLSQVSFPDGLIEIGPSAFQKCTALDNVSIPESVAEIRDAAFQECSSLTQVALRNGITRIRFHVFRDCTLLSDIVIPPTVVHIGQWAFSGCINLASINIPDGVTTIETGAFLGCTRLGGIFLPNSVTLVESYAFRYCESLSNVRLSESMQSIHQYVFANCTALTSITLPQSIKLINWHAFRDCTSLAVVNLGSRVEQIGMSAFRNTALKSITLPASLVWLEDHAFSYCDDLVRVSFLGDAPALVGNYIFEASPVTVYRLQARSGWTDSFGDRPVLLLPEIAAPSIGSDGRFSLRLVASDAQQLIVEVCDELLAGAWIPVFTGGVSESQSIEFTDENSAGIPNRYYRIVLP